MTTSAAVAKQHDASAGKLLMQVNQGFEDTEIVAFRTYGPQWGTGYSSLQKKRQVLAPACSPNSEHRQSSAESSLHALIAEPVNYCT